MTSTILVVDDEDLVRAQISASLDLDGFQVAQAANGNEALAWLRQNAATIAMSGGIRTNAVDVLETARQIGADRVLCKPFGRTQLLTVLRELLPTSDMP